MAKGKRTELYDTLALDDFQEVAEFTTYHRGRPSRPAQIPPEQREFIAWDGEGINLNGEGRPQSYVLFGCSLPGKYILSKEHISVFDAMDLMLDVASANPQAIHVAFAFNYDANQIVRSLQEPTLIRLKKNGHVGIKRPNGLRYRIEWRPGKWFQVTRFGEKYDAEKNPHAKITCRIYDLFGFFTSSFVSAYESNVGPIPAVVLEGKKQRNDFFDPAFVETYWSAEIQCIRELAEELRRRLYGAGLRITQWHGPGALATYALRTHGVKQFMGVAPDAVREAARYAYAGGRFEMYHLGRYDGPIYSLDINSAYPHGIRQLPDLSSGVWLHADGASISKRRRFVQFGVYRIRMLHNPTEPYFRAEPSPIFHRDKMGNISYPWAGEGWYWSPEARNVVKLPGNAYEIVEGWEWVPDNPDTKPFGWVEEMYETRREWKAKGYPTQLALKLCLNSLYGKMAQRVGWNEELRTAPSWHQLEWAGWVTSNCRAMLWDVMRRIPYDKLIAVETDGIYTTMDPAELGITNSKDLGGWELEQYDEIMYVQSGLAWLRDGDKWKAKRRGLDAGTFSLDNCATYLQTLGPREKWTPYTGKTTRFIGLGAALASKAPTKTQLGVWRTSDKEVKPGQNGKRVHMFKQCTACDAGLNAYEGGHDMMIRPTALFDPISHPHDIPWENGDQGYTWREHAKELEGLVVPHE